MTGQEVLDIAQEALVVFLQVSAPLLGISMAVGVVIAFFQSITQIQEMTLTFVPKILAIFTALLILLPRMGSLLSDLMQRHMERIVTGG